MTQCITWPVCESETPKVGVAFWIPLIAATSATPIRFSKHFLFIICARLPVCLVQSVPLYTYHRLLDRLSSVPCFFVSYRGTICLNFAYIRTY
jgi:hypothetical protein